jgi:hypothetical protein
MTESEIKGFKKAIELLEEKLILLDESLDREQIPYLINNKIMQNSGVNLALYWLKEKIK